MTTTAEAITPTTEQSRVLSAILDGVRRGERVQTLGGYAGTGKTSVIRLLRDALPGFAVCAFTGKAASILRRKGVEATTIHSLIYDPVEDEITGEVDFSRRAAIEHAGIIVDEASMVGGEIHDDLLRFGLPVIFVGDHGQLEPVNSDFNLMKSPDHRLETIHRNAGEISRFAEWLRMGKDVSGFPVEADGPVEIIPSSAIGERELWREADQFICAFNKTRLHLNAAIRDMLGYGTAVVVADERAICLRNNRKRGLYNGLQGTVSGTRRSGGVDLLDFDANGRVYRDVPFLPGQFGAEKTIIREPGDRGKSTDLFDYAYCVTCHKAQGDEFDTVLVFEQRCSAWEHRRWAYTAASRARRKLYWVAGDR